MKSQVKKKLRKMTAKFREDLASDMPTWAIAMQYGVTKDFVGKARRLLDVGRRRKFQETKEFVTDIKNGMPVAVIADKYGISKATVSKYRKIHGAERRLFRSTDSTDALMSSSLPAESVARALHLEVKTVKQYRTMYRYHEPQRRTPITPEIRARIIEIGQATVAARVLGIGRSSAYSVLVEHGEQTGQRVIQQYTMGIRWPQDPAWYAERTIPEIAEALGCGQLTARRHIRTANLTYKRQRAPMTK
jgi:DNA-binding CsgD family transcriptional regulator